MIGISKDNKLKKLFVVGDKVLINPKNPKDKTTKEKIVVADVKPEKEKKYAYIFGHEINGVSEEAIKLCDLFIEIPQLGTKHSLNVAVSVGIVCWQTGVI